VIRLGELVMILDLHRQGLSVSAIARQLERDRETVRKYIERGLDPPTYGPRQPRSTVVAPFAPYLRERIAAFPELTGSRLLREIKELGYTGGYTAVKVFCVLSALRRCRRSSAALRPRRASRPRSISRISAPYSAADFISESLADLRRNQHVLPAWTPPWKELVLIPSTNHQSPSSSCTTRGARSRNLGSMRVVQRSGGSITWESDERIVWAVIAALPCGPSPGPRLESGGGGAMRRHYS
jgi:hypothetical protein